MSATLISGLLQKSGFNEYELRLLVNILAEKLVSRVDDLIQNEEGYSISDTLSPLVREIIRGVLDLPIDVLRDS